MKSFLVSVTFLLLVSCDGPRYPPDASKKETPTALKTESSAYSYKRGPSDLVDALYQEEANQSKDLTEIEALLEEAFASKSDSLETFDTYTSQNTAYYLSAHEHMNSMKDSLLRQRMSQLVEANRAAYLTRVAELHALNEGIDQKREQIDDLHQALKLTTTLAIISKFQKESLPDARPLKNYGKTLDKLIQKLNQQLDKKP
ncbi:MAG TPA: hypothetical protein VHK91_08940 [Flavisolibacter sp.]|jgi:hypothetical protein|nr:hypothetical protein [Flavisolibacter sp.]